MSPAPPPATGRRSERGFALMTAVFVLLLVSIALSLLAASLELRLRLVRQEAETLTLTALSDAALAEALAHLAASNGFRGLSQHAFGDDRHGTIESDVEFLAPHQYRVTARATYAGRTRTVEAQVLRTPGLTRVLRWRPVADR